MVIGIMVFLVFVLLCSTGAYFIANTICQNRWKEKVPQTKLVGFAAVFVVVFVMLAILMTMASTVVFGR